MDNPWDLHLEVILLLAYTRPRSLSPHSAGEHKVVLGKTAPGRSDVPQLGGMEAGTSASSDEEHVMIAMNLDREDGLRLS